MDNRKKIYPPRYNYWYWNNVYTTDEIKELHKLIDEKHDKNLCGGWDGHAFHPELQALLCGSI